MSRTAKTGEFVTKDVAAAWAIPQMPDRYAAILDYARRAYLARISTNGAAGVTMRRYWPGICASGLLSCYERRWRV
ncbi:aminoglycoside adenylyltransferase domain-containing protein [Bradyrhizobium sp. 142]|uniref:aminoglycoside adenylyltransferase domain-containing protein n=1 Tax=Bradyrhizobium sp. 142 TaxID=2782618 RepID=UPI00320916A6